MPKFKRKPTPPIEAEHFPGYWSNGIKDFFGDDPITDSLPPENGKHCWDERDLRVWNSEERQHIKVPAGHWVIRGLKGEVYPCSEAVFEASYEEVGVAEAEVIS